MAKASSCGQINTIPGISFFTVAASAILAIGTTTLHGVILHAIIKVNKNKLKIFFYKLLVNISIADILSGILTDPYSVIFHIQESLHKKPIEIKVIHVMLFMFGSVPLATLVLLCVDRILALLRPLTYRHGPQESLAWVLVSCTWIVSAIQVSAYFQLGFIPYLVIFASINIAGASISMIATWVIYHERMGNNALTKVPKIRGKMPSGDKENNNEGGEQRDEQRKEPNKLSRREGKATKTFLIMSIVIVVSYLPTCFATAYMNACTNCDCAIVHSMRDIAIVSILTGPFFRAVTFLAYLKPLRSRLRRGSESDQELPRLPLEERGRKST